MPTAAPDDVTADPLQQGTGSATDKTDDKGSQQKDDQQKAPDASDGGQDVEYWKRRSHENETRARQNAADSKELAALKDKDKTEQQRLTDALAAAETAKQTAETGLLRSTIAASKGLPPEMAGRLTGATKEEIEADADLLIKVIGSGAPKTDLKQGARGSSGGNDVDDWIRQAAGRSNL